ncbi:hypothetical protein HGRIS_004175 [Hohenbuehelia grisea]|uniref:Uncharacterized protein n=1 Tax=Hohenbuehelia grisea TaxID=104357 RepID=A0ABR3JJG0_9AGAR
MNSASSSSSKAATNPVRPSRSNGLLRASSSRAAGDSSRMSFVGNSQAVSSSSGTATPSITKTRIISSSTSSTSLSSDARSATKIPSPRRSTISTSASSPTHASLSASPITASAKVSNHGAQRSPVTKTTLSTSPSSTTSPRPTSSRTTRQATLIRPLPHPHPSEGLPTAKPLSSSMTGPAGPGATGRSTTLKGPRLRTVSSPTVSTTLASSPIQPSRRQMGLTPPSSSASPKSADIPASRSNPARLATPDSHAANADSAGSKKPKVSVTTNIPSPSSSTSTRPPNEGMASPRMVTRSKSAIVGSPVGPRPPSAKGLTGASASLGDTGRALASLSRNVSASASLPSNSRIPAAPASIPGSSLALASTPNTVSRPRQLSAASSSSSPPPRSAATQNLTSPSPSLAQSHSSGQTLVAKTSISHLHGQSAQMQLSSHRASTASDHPPMNLKRLLATPASTSSYASGSDSDAARTPRALHSGTNRADRRTSTMPKSSAPTALANLGNATDGEAETNGAHISRRPSDSDGYKSAPGAIGSATHRERAPTRIRKPVPYDTLQSETERSTTEGNPRLPRHAQSLDAPSGSSSKANSLTPPLKNKGSTLPSVSPPMPSSPADQDRRTRNVLKRRPSTSGTNKSPSTPASYFLFAHPSVQSPMVLSPPGITRSSSRSRSGSRHGSISVPKSRDGSRSAGTSSPMTPAAQVVEAYRQQEARRDDLAGSAMGRYVDAAGGSASTSASASANGSVVSVVRGSTSQGSSPALGTGAAASRETPTGLMPGTPYSAVFGSTSGKIVAVGSPADAWRHELDAVWNREYNQRGRSLDRERPKSAKGGPFGHFGNSGGGGGGLTSGLGKSLSRKVSARWKMSGGVVCGGPSEGEGNGGAAAEQGGDEEEVFAGRTEKEKEKDRTRSFGKVNKRRSLRLSIDKFAELPIAMADSVPVPVLLSDGKAQGEDDKTGSRAAEEPRRKSEPGFLNGGRIWKLMKRISTSGLRDKYFDPEEPPPVPALPKDLSKYDLMWKETLDEKTSPPLRSQLPTSPVQVETPLKKHATAVAKVSGVASTGTVVCAPRLSLNTRSSSPISSELASLRFFKGTHSSRSSTSSFEDNGEAPPLPTSGLVTHHILPPHEFNRSSPEVNKAKSSPKAIPSRPSLKVPDAPVPQKVPSPDGWFIRSPAEERPSLPIPPRRPAQQAATVAGATSVDSSRSASPIIPSFSTSAPINTFTPRKVSPTKLHSPPLPQHQTATVPSDMGSSAPVLSQPPPRPTRSAKRPPLSTSASSSRVTSPNRPSASSARPERNIEAETTAPPRKSLGSLSTTSTFRPSRRSASASPHRAARAAAVFRELPTEAMPSPQLLTEREKSEKWDALLERSARAGGTLHLGGTELLSDRLSCVSTDTAVG